MQEENQKYRARLELIFKKKSDDEVNQETYERNQRVNIRTEDSSKNHQKNLDINVEGHKYSDKIGKKEQHFNLICHFFKQLVTKS